MKGSLWMHLADEVFCIGYRNVAKNYPKLLEENNNSDDFLLLKPTGRYWYADPIPFSFDNNTYVAMEVFDCKDGKGYIGLSFFNKNGVLTSPQKIIDEPFHLSFPYIFTYQGELYLLPESSSVNQIRIYKMGENIYDWNLYHKYDNMTGIVDTIVSIDYNTGYLYLLATQKNKENYLLTQLRYFIIKDWETMQLVDISRSLDSKYYSLSLRNGGKILEYKHICYRVLQESTLKQYGVNLLFSQIDSMDEKSFSEHIVKKVDTTSMQIPLSSKITQILGTHTYGLCEDYEIIDFTLARISLYGLWLKFKRVLSKLLG